MNRYIKTEMPLNKVLYNLYYNSEEVYRIEYDKEKKIKLRYIIYGIFMLIIKSSHFLEVATLNGMFEKTENQIKLEKEKEQRKLKRRINQCLIDDNQEDISISDISLVENCENQVENISNISNENEKTNNGKNQEEKKEKFSCFKKYIHERDRNWPYKIAIMIILSSFQIAYFVFLFQKGLINSKYFWYVPFVRLIFMLKIFEYNIIDFFFYPGNVIKSLHGFTQIFIFFILILFNIVGIIYSQNNHLHFKFTSIKSIQYIENNSPWFKNSEKKYFTPEGFCNVESQSYGKLKTEDLAMLTTIPRLYNFNENGECFIKPSKRGIFNSTMKYIFGKTFENDEIEIYCMKLTIDPVLVITSKKILNQTLNIWSNDNITMIAKDNIINNTDYFKKYSFKPVAEHEQHLLNIYNQCRSKFDPGKCENEWDNFIQYYWSSTYDDNYIDIPGFERYQITVTSNMTFQPSFITSNGKLMAGTHFIVGGGCENRFDIGFLHEAFSRKNIPAVYEHFVSPYKLIRSMKKEVIINLELLNRNLAFNGAIIGPEITKLSELYSKFNFSNEGLFLVGQTHVGTIMKGISYYSDIRGIVFETSDAENIAKINLSPKFNESKKVHNKLINFYSENNKISGFDDDCDINYEIPKGYLFSDVYQTACLTAITCSETMKYVPFCKQVLNKNGNPEEEFNKSLNAYLNYFGYQ